MDPLRRSLFAALGLLTACTPTKGETDTDAQTETSPGTTSSTTATDTTATGTTGLTTTTDPTGGVSDAGTSFDPSTGVPPVTTTDPSTTATDTGASATDTGEPPPVCAGTLTELTQAFVDPPTPSGFVQCDDGLIHRAEKRDCESPVTPTSCPADAAPESACLTDADCIDKPFGSCQVDMVFGGVGPSLAGETCSCVYGCQTDADCGAGEICRCAGDGLGLYTECIPANCTEDADCDGALCGASPDICEPGVFLTACQTPADECDSDADCQGSACMFQEGKWSCSNAACGRPFVVEDEAVTAPAATRDDWRALVAAPVAPEALRAELAAYWTHIGLCEHASVASFARFVLQLLSVGAPPELVLGAQQALADEVEHARVCFALASLYGGTGVGPGALPQASDVGATAFDDVVAAVIREACVGETLSALEVREAALRAEDPALRRALARIADDEQRHAELGWRFVRWALAQASDAQWARAHAAFTTALADAEVTAGRLAEETGRPDLRAHGVVDAPLRAAVWKQGIAALVRPAAEALRDAA